MIKTVIFDFGGVLGPNANEWNTKYKEILKLTGLTAMEMNEIWPIHWADIKTGKKDLKIFWHEVIKRARRKVNLEDIEKVYEENISVDLNVIGLATELKKKGFNIVVLANESKKAMDIKIKKFGLSKLFSRIYCSAHLGMAKPDKKIFKHVLKELKQSPEETVFIDDKERNIEVAQQLKMNAILFRNIKQLKKELKSFGII